MLSNFLSFPAQSENLSQNENEEEDGDGEIAMESENIEASKNWISRNQMRKNILLMEDLPTEVLENFIGVYSVFTAKLQIYRSPLRFLSFVLSFNRLLQKEQEEDVSKDNKDSSDWMKSNSGIGFLSDQRGK